MKARHRKALSEAHQRGRCRRADEQHSVIGRLLCDRGHADLLRPSIFEAEITEILEALANGNRLATVRHSDAHIIQRAAINPRAFFKWCREHRKRVGEWVAEAEMKTAPKPQTPVPSGNIIRKDNEHEQHITAIPAQ